MLQGGLYVRDSEGSGEGVLGAALVAKFGNKFVFLKLCSASQQF
jgi:hypothetical protein